MQVYLRYGAPRIWPFSWQAVKAWAVPATASTDFQYAIIAMVFIPAKPIVLVSYHVCCSVACACANTSA